MRLSFKGMTLFNGSGHSTYEDRAYEQPTYSFHNYGGDFALRVCSKGETDPVVHMIFTGQDFIQFIMKAEMALRDVKE